jgi:hypothetical protein
MRDWLVLMAHLIVTIIRIIAPGGARSVVAESLLLKHQLLILNRSRRKAPPLRALDRFLLASGAFTPDSVVERHSSGAAQLHSNRRISSSSLGDPTVPASFTRQLPRNQEFAMVRVPIQPLAHPAVGQPWRFMDDSHTGVTVAGCGFYELSRTAPVVQHRRMDYYRFAPRLLQGASLEPLETRRLILNPGKSGFAPRSCRGQARCGPACEFSWCSWQPWRWPSGGHTDTK